MDKHKSKARWRKLYKLITNVPQYLSCNQTLWLCSTPGPKLKLNPVTPHPPLHQNSETKPYSNDIVNLSYTGRVEYKTIISISKVVPLKNHFIFILNLIWIAARIFNVCYKVMWVRNFTCFSFIPLIICKFLVSSESTIKKFLNAMLNIYLYKMYLKHVEKTEIKRK